MEFKNHEKLQILRGKALELHERMKEKMKEQHSFSFCSHCSSHGRYCVVADCSPEERERMIAITDSLKDLHNLILSLQKVKWKHKRQRDEAIARIEESRKAVRERVERLSKDERESSNAAGGVVEEVIEFVGDGKSDEFWWNLDDERNVNGRFYSFVVGTTRFGFEFLVIFATIYYASLKFGRNEKQQENKHGVIIDSRIKKPSFLRSDDGDVVHLDVLCGRG